MMVNVYMMTFRQIELDKPISIFSSAVMQQITASARKHTGYLYPVVHKTCKVCKQKKRIIDHNKSLQMDTNARKHTE